MKKILVVALVVAVALLGASAAFATVANSKHDLSSASTNTLAYHVTAGGLSACQYCHTPHGSNTVMAAAPIWNRTAGTSTITMYATGSGNKTIGGTTMNGAIGAISLACLSCHDGTISVVNTFANGNYTGAAAAGNVSAAGLITGLPLIAESGNLTNDHPVGMVVTDGTATVAGLDTLANMKTAKFLFFGASQDTMECGTCHDPHDTTNAPFLRASLNTICVTCHKNK